MVFHCRASEAPADEPGDHGRKKERLRYSNLSRFRHDGCSVSLDRGVSALMTATPPTVERLPDLFQGGIVFRFGLFKASPVLEQGAR